MLKQIILLLLFGLALPLCAREKEGFYPGFSASLSTLFSSGSDLPFWMVSNSDGIFTLHNPAYLLFQAGLKRGLERDSLKKCGYYYGGNLVYSRAGTADFQPNEYYAGLRFRSLIIKIGAESDPVLFSGLSSTNGNMYRSRNARPVPGLSLTTNGFIPFSFAKKRFSYRFLYNEGLLKDKQSVLNAHLHHKYLYFKGIVSSSLSITLGLEHYVFWGGYSPIYGQQPGWSSYFRYILGLKGGKGAAISDQQNVAGNQLGSYNLSIDKELVNMGITFYWNHPFEDRSGMELDNIRDGLWGIHLKKKKRETLITDLVYEYMYTLNQSGPFQLQPAPTPQDPDRRSGRGDDNYFNNGVYTSGFTHYQRMMGTPLFQPDNGDDGISKGFQSTRMWMHHIGLSGLLGKRLSWKSLMTWSRNFGSFQNVLPNPTDEFSFLSELTYLVNYLPFVLKAGFAGDYGERFEHRYGGYLGVGIHF